LQASVAIVGNNLSAAVLSVGAVVESSFVTLPVASATASTPPGPSPRSRLFSNRLTLLWVLNFLAVAAVGAWILGDRSAARILGVSTPAPYTTWYPAGGTSTGLPRAAALRAGVAIGLAGFGFISVVIFFLGLLFGTRAQRGLRSWLALTALVAAWFGLMASRDELAWARECWHMRRQIPQFEPLAARLRNDFPKRDGTLPELGNFTAYPVDKPQMLLVFIAQTPPGRATVAAVERSPAGALRFALASEQLGQWLEWHPPDSRPASFTGTLAEYRLDRSKSLEDGWFLTRYK
jgi:hypothetical protein